MGIRFAGPPKAPSPVGATEGSAPRLTRAQRFDGLTSAERAERDAKRERKAKDQEEKAAKRAANAERDAAERRALSPCLVHARDQGAYGQHLAGRAARSKVLAALDEPFVRILKFEKTQELICAWRLEHQSKPVVGLARAVWSHHPEDAEHRRLKLTTRDFDGTTVVCGSMTLEPDAQGLLLVFDGVFRGPGSASDPLNVLIGPAARGDLMPYLNGLERAAAARQVEPDPSVEDPDTDETQAARQAEAYIRRLAQRSG